MKLLFEAPSYDLKAAEIVSLTGLEFFTDSADTTT